MKLKLHQVPHIAAGMRRVKEAAANAKGMYKEGGDRGSFYSMRFNHILDYMIKTVVKRNVNYATDFSRPGHDVTKFKIVSDNFVNILPDCISEYGHSFISDGKHALCIFCGFRPSITN